MGRAAILLAALINILRASAAADQSYIRYPVTAPSQVQPPSDCAQYFHDDCKNWKIAEWLPFLPSGRNAPRSVPFMDGFEYDGKIPNGPDWIDLQGAPTDGTAFVYGKAGPPRGVVVYDYAHAIAFYSQGCCAWHSTVLASGASAPPVLVIHRSLRNVRTAHGIALGEDPQHVQAIYGKTTLEPLPRYPGMTVLSYAHALDKMCSQSQTFVFLHSHLVYIELDNAC